MCVLVQMFASPLVCAQWVSEEWKSISYQRPYCIICVIYCTICLWVKIAFKDWWCLQDYTISKELSDPPPEQWNEIYLTCYLSYVYALSPQIYLGICISLGDYSKRRLPQCCEDAPFPLSSLSLCLSPVTFHFYHRYISSFSLSLICLSVFYFLLLCL